MFTNYNQNDARFQGLSGGGGGLGSKMTPAYGCMLGLLFAAYTFTGYDGPTHLSEETKAASVATPRGVMMSFASSSISGWLFAIASACAQHGSTHPQPADALVP